MNISNGFLRRQHHLLAFSSSAPVITNPLILFVTSETTGNSFLPPLAIAACAARPSFEILVASSYLKVCRVLEAPHTSLTSILFLGHISKKAASLSTPVSSLKLPPVTGLSFSTARSKDWDDILSAHKQESVARTWSLQNKKLGNWSMNFADDNADGKKWKTPVGSVRVSRTFLRA